MAKEGRSGYTIVTSAEPDVAEQHAAEELQAFLKDICGAELAISRSSVDGPMIYVRASTAAGDVLGGVPPRKLEHEEILIRTVGENLVLAGDGGRGAHYAVYTFLEDQLGCRWYATQRGQNPACQTIPRTDTIRIPPLGETGGVPFFSAENHGTPERPFANFTIGCLPGCCGIRPPTWICS